jgi:hypothetical protein
VSDRECENEANANQDLVCGHADPLSRHVNRQFANRLQTEADGGYETQPLDSGRCFSHQYVMDETEIITLLG